MTSDSILIWKGGILINVSRLNVRKDTQEPHIKIILEYLSNEFDGH